MDLYAYSQIEKIGQIAAQNGIVVPRLRGYRLMADEGYEVPMRYRKIRISKDKTLELTFRPITGRHSYADRYDNESAVDLCDSCSDMLEAWWHSGKDVEEG